MTHRARTILAAAGVVTTLAAVAPAAQAAPTVAGEFPLPGGATVGSNNEIVQGPDGNMWVTTDEATPSIVSVTPAGTVTRHTPGGLAQSATGIVAGPDGNLWAAQSAGVVKITPGPPVVAAQTNYGVAGGQGITVGPDGNIWLAATGKLIKIPPAAPGTATQYNVPAITAPKGMTTGSDGLLWIADGSGNVISATATDPPVPTSYPTGGGPQDVAAGPNAQVAYPNPTTAPMTVGRIVPGGSAVTTPLENTDPFGVTFGQDGAYWIARTSGNDLLRLTTDGNVTTLGGFAAHVLGPRKVATGPENTLWVTIDMPDAVARITGVEPPAPDPQPTDPPPPPPGTAPETTLVKGPDKKVEAKESTGKAKVKFIFGATGNAPSFQCTLTKKGKSPKVSACTSPMRYKLKPARYTFAVAATADGLADQSPATTKFRVVDP